MMRDGFSGAGTTGAQRRSVILISCALLPVQGSFGGTALSYSQPTERQARCPGSEQPCCRWRFPSVG